MISFVPFGQKTCRSIFCNIREFIMAILLLSALYRAAHKLPCVATHRSSSRFRTILRHPWPSESSFVISCSQFLSCHINVIRIFWYSLLGLDAMPGSRLKCQGNAYAVCCALFSCGFRYVVTAISFFVPS